MIHSTCEIHSEIDDSVTVWNRTQIMENVRIGKNTNIGRDVFIGSGTRIGQSCKIQNSCQIFGAHLSDHVFLGPNVVIVEDPWPRTFEMCEKPEETSDITFFSKPVIIEEGASIGAGAIISPGVRIGKYAMVGIGSVVIADVEPNTLVIGNPARSLAEVCRCGRRKKMCLQNCE